MLCKVVSTFGTTSCCAFDDMRAIAAECREQGLWLHVDAAYAGSALILDEFRREKEDGLDLVQSININPSK